MFRSLTNIVLHHSASAINTTIAQIRKWHVEDNGWNSIGYHYVIAFDGLKWRIYTCRPVIIQGAHCPKRNADSIGICVCGNFDKIDLPQEAYDLLVSLIARLCARHGIDPLEITGHRDWKSTICPGKNLYRRIPEIKMEVKSTQPLPYH